MKYLSVCSGIEAATVAWRPLSWEAVGFSEIEAFPAAVLQHHYPNTFNYGDMTNHERWTLPDFDVLVGGTPCQSFSVAGLRRGMADPRGNLSLTYLALAAERRPRWLVWENVPGVLSSNGGRDFGAFIGGLAELGYSAAWRILDAQYFGLAQRRRRVFVVASARGWADCAAVLFEPESLRGNPAPSRGQGQGAAEAPPRGAETSGRIPDVAKSIRGNSGGIDREDMHTLLPEPVVGALTAKGPEAMGAPEVDAGHYLPETVGTLSDGAHMGGGLNGQDAYSGRIIPVLADPLVAKEGETYTHEGKGNFRLRNVVGCFDETQITHPENRSSASPETAAMNSHARPPTIAFKASHYTRGKDGAPGDVTPPLSADADRGDQDTLLAAATRVRRLTPLECERLQGFPDNYTNIAYGRPKHPDQKAPDGPRYKALGNSMAVPVMAWIGRRIDQQTRRTK